ETDGGDALSRYRQPGSKGERARCAGSRLQCYERWYCVDVGDGCRITGVAVLLGNDGGIAADRALGVRAGDRACAARIGCVIRWARVRLVGKGPRSRLAQFCSRCREGQEHAVCEWRGLIDVVRWRGEYRVGGSVADDGATRAACDRRADTDGSDQSAA